MTTNEQQLNDEKAACGKSPSTGGLCPPFTPKEWYAISLCIGWTLAMADKSPEGGARIKAAERSITAMSRVFGEQFHTRIADVLEKTQGHNVEISGAGTASAGLPGSARKG